MGKVKLVKLILPQAEIEKLTAKDKKRYVMFTSMLRDLNLLQKCLVFVGNVDSSDTPSKSAKTTIAFFFLKTLISKIHEMGVFLDKTKVVESVGSLNDVRETAAQVKNFFGDQKVDGICSFIRNKFGFHYEYWDEVDALIENEAKQFTEFEIWLSMEDSGNEIFASTNAVMLKVIFAEMKKLGFIGDDAKLFDDLFEIALRGARILREFTVAYLIEALPITWVKTEEVEIMSPLYSEVKLPLIVAGRP